MNDEENGNKTEKKKRRGRERVKKKKLEKSLAGVWCGCPSSLKYRGSENLWQRLELREDVIHQLS
jgi:hypothetical protein